MTARHLMKCGHVGRGFTLDDDGKKWPACTDCFMAFLPGAFEVVGDLTGRTAKCRLCDHSKPSDFDMMNFAWHRDEACDWFECGCRGTE